MSSRITLVFQDYWQPSWRILVGIIAVLDILHCWPVLVEGWWSSRQTTKVAETFLGEFWNKRNPHHHSNSINDGDVCPVEAAAAAAAAASIFGTLTLSIGWIFSVVCIVEAILRAQEARQLALDNAALDRFEQKLASLYHATSFSVFRQQPSTVDSDYILLARNTLRFWTPVASILLGWSLLLPWSRLLRCSGPWDFCRDDPSVATYAITTGLSWMSSKWEVIKDAAVSFVWKLALPMSLLQKPLALWRRLRLLSKWVRYLRFAGPIIRMAFKVQDQVWVFTKTWNQSWYANAEKAKRLARRSMIFEDIQKIESLAKVQATLANLPSQLFLMASKSRADLSRLVHRKQEEGQRLRQRLSVLKQEISRSSRLALPNSELYDRVVDLYQELTSTMSQAVWNSHLISPQTRFSVGWRITVTMALLAELTRLFVSWQHSQSFELRYTDMTKLLLLDCDQKSRPVRRFFARLFRKHHQLDSPLSLCSPASPSGWLFLWMARGTEISIDVVCFLDIFVWFFTGELDAKGVIIPKHFISRCIIPGTLIQVLDHPTLPGALPELLAFGWAAVHAVGYGRAMRWALGVVPAIHLVVLQPLLVYLFRPMDRDEFILYTESLALLPTSFSTNTIRRPYSSRRFIREGSRPSLGEAPTAPVETYNSPPSSPKRKKTSFLPQGIDHSWMSDPRIEISSSYGNFLTTIDDDDDSPPRPSISSRLEDSVGYGLYY